MSIPCYQDLQNAIEFVVRRHNGQYRKRAVGGTLLPYVVHPISVMQLVWKWGAGSLDVLKATLCHDLIEDCGVTYEELVKEIGKTAADIVVELSFIPPPNIKLDSDEFRNLKDSYLQSFRTKSIYAIIIKLADRFCNSFDFKLTDPKYASKYFRKADSLFTIYRERSDEIGKEFGESTQEQVFLSFVEVSRIIHGEHPGTRFSVSPM